MTPFDSKQFEIKREDQAIARWTGPKDDATLVQLLDLFRRETLARATVYLLCRERRSQRHCFHGTEGSQTHRRKRRLAILTKRIYSSFQ